MSGREYPFALDGFQTEAIKIVDADRSIVVAAPTGSGKTIVAEHAVAKALAEGGRAFYTTPIKALSNQKFHDLRREFGAERVGLLTGDNSINGNADVVVMTTEVLRNMIYAGSGALDRLTWVVLDEVHYLQDPYRGPVWEEIIVHLPQHCRLVCLSATVSNADELTDWLTSVRGPTDVVVEHRRPVELDHLYMIDDPSSETPHVVPILIDGRPNPEGSRFDAMRNEGGGGSRKRDRGRRRWRTPRRLELIDMLLERELLPGIVFVFSRAGCDDAVKSCLASGVSLTSDEERGEIAGLIDRHLGNFPDADRRALEYDHFERGLLAGVVAHHAGMVPAFKEAVEEAFVRGLAKVVFATETLALGINMPARSVVIEKLSKFTGEQHEDLTPAVYTQLTGRAGRRGIDDAGTAIVLWSPFADFGLISGLAASRSFGLRSAFRPTYNMVANLVGRYEEKQARHLIRQSFAQFQADRAATSLDKEAARRVASIERHTSLLTMERDDLAKLRDGVVIETTLAVADIDAALATLKPGDVIRKPGDAEQRLAVLSVAFRRGTPQIRVTDIAGFVETLDSSDFQAIPVAVGRIELPEPYLPSDSGFVAEVSYRLERTRARSSKKKRTKTRSRNRGATTSAEEAQPRPFSGDLKKQLKTLARLEWGEKELARVEKQIERARGGLSRDFEQILAVLRKRGHVDGWELTETGLLLAACYNESDLLVVETLHAGVFDGLEPASLAGLASCLTYEHRSRVQPPPPRFPDHGLRDRYRELREHAEELNRDEGEAGLALTRLPDPTFLPLSYDWARGGDLDRIIDMEAMSGGDFVRTVKQLIDLLRQLGELAPEPATARTARQAADALFRGVVAASTVVSEEMTSSEYSQG